MARMQFFYIEAVKDGKKQGFSTWDGNLTSDKEKRYEKYSREQAEKKAAEFERKNPGFKAVLNYSYDKN